MAFANGFNGDTVSLGYILKTLDKKAYMIPGLTCNPDISVNASGETAYYYSRGDSTVSDGTQSVGSQITYTSTGVTKHSIDLSKCFQIKFVIPHVNFATVSADVLGDKIVQETITLSNKWNALMASKIEAAPTRATAGTKAKNLYTLSAAPTVSTVYGDVLGAKAQFISDNKDKFLKPTAIFASPAVVAALKEKNLILFKDGVPNGSEKVLGYFDGMAVIECPDLSAKTQFILINMLAFGAPINVNTMVIQDATAAGYPAGVLGGGELGYGFEVSDDTLIYKYVIA